MSQDIAIGSIVQCHHPDGWFDEGTVISIIDDVVQVDMADWIQGWPIGELHAVTDHYRSVFVPSGPGWLIRSFGQGNQRS